MNKIVSALSFLLLITVNFAFADDSASASTIASPISVGASCSFNSYLGLSLNYDMASEHGSKLPNILQAYYKTKNEAVGTVSGTHYGMGVLGLYDMSKFMSLNKKAKPYLGVGLGYESQTLSSSTASASSTSLGIQLAAGVTYELQNNLLLDANYSFGNINVGLDYHF